MFAVVCLVYMIVAADALSQASVSTRTAQNFVVLPGFGNDAMDYRNPAGLGEELSMVHALQCRGHACDVVPIERTGWLRIAQGIFVPRFWRYEVHLQD
jgi:hypothetical protein